MSVIHVLSVTKDVPKMRAGGAMHGVSMVTWVNVTCAASQEAARRQHLQRVQKMRGRFVEGSWKVRGRLVGNGVG